MGLSEVSFAGSPNRSNSFWARKATSMQGKIQKLLQEGAVTLACPLSGFEWQDGEALRRESTASDTAVALADGTGEDNDEDGRESMFDLYPLEREVQHGMRKLSQ